MDEHTRDQMAKNEALFRDVNERVKEVDRSHNIPVEDLWDFLCECANSGCLERLSLTLGEYEDVRSNPTTFVVKHGHERPEVEAVVSATDRYVIVEKHPGEDAIARATDPRS